MVTICLDMGNDKICIGVFQSFDVFLRKIRIKRMERQVPDSLYPPYNEETRKTKRYGFMAWYRILPVRACPFMSHSDNQS